MASATDPRSNSIRDSRLVTFPAPAGQTKTRGMPGVVAMITSRVRHAGSRDPSRKEIWRRYSAALNPRVLRFDSSVRPPASTA